MSIAHPSEPRKLRRNSLKEEMVALTEDTIDALLLNQLIKYQAMSRDREKFIEEEKKRLAHHGQEPNVYNERGWFYKTTSQLAEESMISLAESSINKRIERFQAKGWLTKRNNPTDAWDKKTYYRVHVVEIDRQLLAIGYFLSGWLIHRINPLRPSTEDEYSESKTRSSETETRSSETEIRVSETEVRSSDSEGLTSTPLTSTFKQDVENKQQQHGVDVDDADGSSSGSSSKDKLGEVPLGGGPVASEPSAPSTPRAGSERLSPEAPEAAELLSRLLTLGVVKADLGKGAKRVAGALTMVQVCPDTVRVWLDWLPDAMLDMEEAGAPVTNVGGFLAHCIRNQMPMPARTKTRLDAYRTAALARQARESRLAQEQEEAARRADEQRHKQAQEQNTLDEAALLDAQWDQLEPEARARTEAQVNIRLGVLGRMANNDGARRAMRRTLLREMAEQGQLSGPGLLHEVVELSPVERASASG